MSDMLKPKTPKAATVAQPETLRIPTQDDPDVRAAQRTRRQQDQKNRRGRESTNHAGSAPVYSRTKLG